MHFTTRFMALSAIMAALLLATMIGDPTMASAQTPPATFYGKGLRASDRVEAFIGGRSCGTATANAAGEWSISVSASAPCGPTAGAATSFTLNGAAARITPAATWQGGGLPPDVANGYTLAAQSGVATPTATGGAAPTAPRTGNAGLLGGEQARASAWLVGAAAVLTLGAAAAGRRLVRERR